MIEPLILFAAALAVGVLSGMSGGGGGMIMVPLLIFMGLSPQQAVATIKMNGIGTSLGGVSVFRKSGHIRKDIAKVMIPIGLVIALLVPYVFVRIDSDFMQRFVGLMILVLVPLLFLKKKPRPDVDARRSAVKRTIGYVTYAFVLAGVALFGGGIGSLAMFVLTLLFGTSVIEANATKRAITACMVPVTFIGLLLTGFVVLSYGIAVMIGGYIGSHYGSKIVLRSGEAFARWAMATIAALSGIVLLITA